MSALNFIITDAGRAALASAGTLGPVSLTQIGIGSSGYTPTSSQTALVAQIKTLTLSGSVPTPGTIHMTVEDTSSDAYEVKEVGVFTSTGVLFAVYSQSDDILVKAAESTSLFALDLVIAGADPSSITIGDTGFLYPPATETVKGVAMIATTAEVTAGTDDTTIVTPLKLRAGYVQKAGDTMTGPLTLAADPVAPFHAVTKEYADNKFPTEVSFVGSVTYFATATAPAGWLVCNGATVNRTTYAALFAVIGTAWGAGDGSTTFQIPDLRGEFVRGWDNGRSIDPGRAFGSEQPDAFGSHNHGINDPTHAHQVFGGSNIGGTPNGLSQSEWNSAGVVATTFAAATGITIQNSGTTETRPRNVALLACIRY